MALTGKLKLFNKEFTVLVSNRKHPLYDPDASSDLLGYYCPEKHFIWISEATKPIRRREVLLHELTHIIQNHMDWWNKSEQMDEYGARSAEHLYNVLKDNGIIKDLDLSFLEEEKIR